MKASARIRRLLITALILVGGFFLCQWIYVLFDQVMNGFVVDWFEGHYILELWVPTGENEGYYNRVVRWNKLKPLMLKAFIVFVMVWILSTRLVSILYAARQERRVIRSMGRMIGNFMHHDREASEVFPGEYAEVSVQMAQIKAQMQSHEQMLRDEAAKKNDLITYLAHDLKTPLTSVIGYLSLLEEAPELPLEQRAKYVRITLEKAQNLEKLINEFFEITRYNLQQIVLEKESVDLPFMLVQMTDEFYPVLSARGNTIRLDIEPEGTGCSPGFVGESMGDGVFAGEGLEDGVFVGECAKDGVFAGECEEDGVFAGDSPEDGGFAGEGPEDGVFAEEGREDGVFAGDSPEDGFLAGEGREEGVFAGECAEDGVFAGDSREDGFYAGESPKDGVFTGEGAGAVNPEECAEDGFFAGDSPEDGFFAGESPDAGLTVYADAEKLARVFNNILKNAIAYSYPDTEIWVGCGRRGDKAYVVFANRGRTIPRQKLDAIFEKFFRLDDARSTNTGGAGLGLAIAREIVTLHGGTITAHSEDEVTTFTVELPL